MSMQIITPDRLRRGQAIRDAYSQGGLRNRQNLRPQSVQSWTRVDFIRR